MSAFKRNPESEPQFLPGDIVMIMVDTPPHCRQPHQFRGQIGSVVRVQTHRDCATSGCSGWEVHVKHHTGDAFYYYFPEHLWIPEDVPPAEIDDAIEQLKNMVSDLERRK